MLWGDAKLDGANPAIKIRASISKNHREANLPLHPDVVAALLKMRPQGWQPDQKIFAGLYPGYKHFYADLKAAGIDFVDEATDVSVFTAFGTRSARNWR